MSKKNGGKGVFGVQTMEPPIETMDPEMETRGAPPGESSAVDPDIIPVAPAPEPEQKPDPEPEPPQYVVKLRGNIRVVECPACKRLLLGDRMTQACVVTRTMPEVADAGYGRYVDRYLLCRGCGKTSKVREILFQIP